ncbi:hypothetical protein D0Z03_000267 [Geotrichum reessii]|nr:hypothetical protein D0Z03_000267 [Galactomyces reessii]
MTSSQSAPTSSKSTKSKSAANAHNALANQLLLPTERDDLAFTYLNPADLEASFQNANETDFVDEKEDYLAALTSRINNIEFTDLQRSQRKCEAFQQRYLAVFQNRAKYQRRAAAKEILSEAIQKVLQREEAEELREKKRHKLALQKERRAKRAAALRAEKAQELALANSSNDKEDDKKMPATPSKSSKNKKQDVPVNIAAAPSVSTASKKSSDGTAASRITSNEIKETKPVVKGPSQKEIRSVARHYQNTYDAIWRDMARKDANKTFRLAHSNLVARINNARKTSVLASKEAKKWQSKTTKNLKDLQNKARRGMREMLTFWRRNEREERELRKKAEKEAQDQAKREEEAREARRQARKLNFLISQTELYTHFIANKINPADKAEKKTVKDLDFDSENEDELHQVAMANAQKAFQETQSKARSFNDTNEVEKVDLDEEMNFQNPTSLGDILISQPKLLSCQLKEYQIKGLSWLANLYEQGINGILADEMGLGKTVQSISVMAYLAEKYNIWGPFLVVTPASTLHNWQQEIAKFVPDFKVLPYWGNAKDRKVLRKFWDHKNVKYNRDSQFHVLVTSYQMVVADASYFQKMKWQYMILDEAQAIKSSTSSRWKSLLSFQCRNRLLLTGTPIQNSMQELWALLHFIMPSLFDSHDEFSEWFANDIENSGKLSKLDEMLPVLKANDHRVLIYFQMTKMMDLMEEYLTFRQYKYVRLDGSSKLSDRRDLVNDWQTKPELFIFLLSTRAGGLGINLTAADTVIFYDSDWNPTIDSQAMDRAHRMGQTKQVTVYRLLVKGTIEERMRDRAKQKMQVQKVVMEGGGGESVDFKEKPGREVAYWLLDDDATADAIISKNSANNGGKSKKRNVTATSGPDGSINNSANNLELMYHEGEGNFDESSQAPSGANTPQPPKKPRNKRRRMNTEQRLQAVGSGNFDD